MIDYYSLLLHPKWKRKRKMILVRDNYKCTVCGSTRNLVVHHTFYKSDSFPWQYRNKDLITLCQHCHEDYHRAFEVKFKKPGKQLEKKKFKAIYKNGKKYKKVQRKICGEIKEVWREF